MHCLQQVCEAAFHPKMHTFQKKTQITKNNLQTCYPPELENAWSNQKKNIWDIVVKLSIVHNRRRGHIIGDR